VLRTGTPLIGVVFTVLKLFGILAVLGLSVAAFGQVCDSAATGSQPYSLTGSAMPQSAVLPLLGYFATGDVYEPLPEMPSQPTSFCGPLWQANYPYVVGNMIEPLPLGAVFQAVPNPDCSSDCKSGSTQPPGFAGPLTLPSNIYVNINTCSDPGTTATCTMIGPEGDPSPLNLTEPYQGAIVGSTVVIQNYSNSAYNGAWVVTASTNPPGPPFESPFTFSFTASGLGSGDCTDFKVGICVAYEQGTQITDGGILWQYVGPQNEVGPVVVVTPSPFSITTAQTLNVAVTVGGGADKGTPTGTVTLTSGNYASAATTLNRVNGDGSATITIPAGVLAVGVDALTANYSGDDNYGMATGVNSVTVTGVGILTPTVTVQPFASSITTAQSDNVTITVSGGSGDPTPTGTVTLTSGTYASAVTTLIGGSATITIPAGSLAVGTDTVTATYAGDSNYSAANGTASIIVTAAPSFTLSAAPSSLTIVQGSDGTSTITVTPSGGFTGSVTLASSGLPSGVTAMFGTNPTTGTSLLTLTASSSATTGPATVTITGTSGSLSATTTVALTVVSAPSGSFTLSVKPASVTISSPGQSGTVQATVTPGPGGFIGTVSIACTLPAAMTESNCPTVTATLAGSAAANVPVVVTTTAPQAAATRTAMNDMFGFGLLVGVCAFAIPGLRRTKAPLALLLLAIVVLIVGCGGGSGTGPSNPGTPAGTYAVTLTATSGSVSAPSITFQVTVQ